MPRFDDMAELRQRLLDGGVSLNCIRRTLCEIEDHIADIEADATKQGLAPDLVADEVSIRLGRMADIAGSVIAQPQLRSRFARFELTKPLRTCLLHVQLAGFTAGSVAKWGMAASASMLCTSVILFCLQLTMSLA